ncbi:MAG: choice-of-anchor D domain-containing protein, partial [Planctomycetes bacterium]|nr:choice-of-anchor D domain-containing protein [Planctomycetota bacterium]
SAKVSIANNDSDENPYIFEIKGAGVVPEINIKQGSTDIPSGSGIFNFGEVVIGDSTLDITFTIENTGNGDLILEGVPSLIAISGHDDSIFTLNQSSISSPISPSTSTSFTISFHPTIVGTKSASIIIANNDNNKNPYIFLVVGIGSANPEINIHDSDLNDIVSGSGSFDFGLLGVNLTKEETFTIQNTGDGDLILSGNPIITITGVGENVFSVTEIPSSTISPGFETIFKIEFTPLDRQEYSAIVSIANNDLDEDPYTFTLTGIGFFTDTTFDFNGDGYDDIIVGAYEDDDGGSESGCAFIFFGSQTMQATIDASSADVKFVGSNIGDKFGFSVSSAGDFNLDGFDDAIIGAVTDDDGGVDSGCSFIFFGTDEPTSVINVADADIIITGENTGDHFGFSVSSAGDFNNDGTSDVLIGARATNSGGNAYIFLGRQDPSSMYDASDADIIISTDTGSRFLGFSVSYAGDFNNDDIDDIIIGAYGHAHIFFGSSYVSTSFSTSDADVILNGAESADRFGFSVSNAGDVNNDGFDDVIVGAPKENHSGSKSGHAYIFFGSSDPVSSRDASDADVELIGEDDGDSFGRSVSYAGDINNDGFSDVIVGSPTGNSSNNYSGCAFIFFGGLTMLSEIYSLDADIRINGDDNEDYCGIAVSTLGDVNQDGIEDFIIGALLDDDGGLRSGCAFIFFGKGAWVSPMTASDSEVKLVGEDAGDYFGWSVSSAGEVNNDGLYDIIIGASNDDDNGSNSGCAFIFFSDGGNSTKDATEADVKIIGEQANFRLGYSVTDVGDINNDGLHDIAVSSPNNNVNGVDAGCVYVFYGRQNWNPVINSSTADVKIYGENSRDLFGWIVNRGGDVNGDSIDDLVFGTNNNGCVYIFFGKNNFSSSINASNADVKIIDANITDNFGIHVVCAGDLNKDGYDDFMVSAHGNSDSSHRAGAMFVFMGRANWNTVLSATTAEIKLYGVNNNDFFSSSISPAGDLNNDGYMDIMGTSLNDDEGGIRAGAVYVFFGSSNWNSVINAANADIKLIGGDVNDNFGRGLSGGGN